MPSVQEKANEIIDLIDSHTMNFENTYVRTINKIRLKAEQIILIDKETKQGLKTGDENNE